jgi:hypothetical protein
MNYLTKVISTTVDKLNRRVVKILKQGKSDVQTAFDISSFGIDGNPTKDLIAVYADTNENGKPVIIGYINKNKKAGIGELRFFSTDENGEEKFYVWLKNNGVIEIGGNTNYAVKFNELKVEFNKLKASHNDLLTEYKTHTHTGVTVGSGVTGTTVSTQSPNDSDIENAKQDKIKTI